MIGTCDICDRTNAPVSHHHPDSLGPEGDICYLCQGDIADPYCEMEVECTSCGGDGGWDVVTGYDPRDGQPTGYWMKCGVCDGKRGEFIKCEPITLEDFDDCFWAAP